MKDIDLDDVAATSPKAKLELEALRSRLSRLETWLEGDAYCPCCTGIRVCSEDCTYETDDPHAFERMSEARFVLFEAKG